MTVVDLRRRHHRQLRSAAKAGLVVVVALGLVAGTGAAAWLTGWFDLDEIAVRGVQRTAEADVEQVVAPQVGRPLPTVDVVALEVAIEQLPLVADASVRRAWPSGVDVVVRERVPVAAVPTAGGFDLSDDQGVVVETVVTAPADLPVVTTDLAAGPAGLTAALTVLSGLPPELADTLTATSANSAADVRLVISGRDVRWGTPDESSAKARVVIALLGVPDVGLIDVSAPAAPVTRP